MTQQSTESATVATPADDVSLDDIKSLEAFCTKYPDVAPEPRMRWWIFHRKSNGLESSGAIIKKAGRWFIVVPRLRDWLVGSRSLNASREVAQP